MRYYILITKLPFSGGRKDTVKADSIFLSSKDVIFPSKDISCFSSFFCSVGDSNAIVCAQCASVTVVPCRLSHGLHLSRISSAGKTLPNIARVSSTAHPETRLEKQPNNPDRLLTRANAATRAAGSIIGRHRRRGYRRKKVRPGIALLN